MDITEENSQIKITQSTDVFRVYNKTRLNYYEFPSGRFVIMMDGMEYSCSFVDLTINTDTPASVADAYADLNEIFKPDNTVVPTTTGFTGDFTSDDGYTIAVEDGLVKSKTIIEP